MSRFGGDRLGTQHDIADAIYVADAAAKTALSSLRDGQLVVQIDTNELYSWDAGGATFVAVGSSQVISVDDTNTIDLTEALGVLTAALKYQDSNSVNLSDDGSGLKADVVTQNTNTADLSEDASGIKVDINYQDSNSVDLSDDGSGLKADIRSQNTNTVNLTEDASGVKADVSYQDSNSINLSDDVSGLKADVVSQNTNTVNLSEDASGIKADVNYQDSNSIDLSDDASGVKADVKPAGVDHDQLSNTHNLTTDIDHNSITNTHNLTTDIDHTAISNIGSNSHATIDSHIGASTAHGVSGSVVGTSDSQVLTGKTIDADSNTVSNIANDEVKAAAGIVESKLSLDYSTSSLNSAIGGKQADVITTRGDVIIGDASGDASRLALGDAGQVLISDGTDLSWQDAPSSIIKVAQATHGFTLLQPVYQDYSDDTWYEAKADDSGTLATHIIVEVTDTGNFVVAQSGRFTLTSHGETEGFHWVSNATAGDTATTEPTSGFSNPAYYVIDANTVDIYTNYRPSAVEAVDTTPQIVYFKDVKATTTAGGTSVSGWQTRTLNTTENSQSWASLATNQITLDAGTYRVTAGSTIYRSGRHASALYNVSDAAYEVVGINSSTDETAEGTGNSVLTGVFTIAATKIFELRVYAESGRSTDGLGKATSSGQVEIYAQVEIQKI